MIKYSLVTISPDEYSGYPYINIVNTYSDILKAEKARSAYLVVYPDMEPQNLQVIQYKDNTDDIPF
jgi:hypothetical protein